METLLSPFTPEFEPPRDDPPPDFFDRYRYYILGVLLVVLAVGLYLMLTPQKNTIIDEDAYITGGSETTISDASGQLVVDIAGGVNQPGVYQLDVGAIVEDAIVAAGGLSDLADTGEIARNINRAALITNHSKIYIPLIGDNQIVYVNPTSYSPANPLTSSPANLVNINTANTNGLDTLPGIGPITAQRIVDYRLQNGPFSSIDELKNVPGIGDSKFNSLKDLITI